jgi:hypothetical protein
MRQIEGDQIMPQQECGAGGEVVEPAQVLLRAAFSGNECRVGIAAHRSETVDAAVANADFEVDGQAVWSKPLASPGRLHGFVRRSLRFCRVTLCVSVGGLRAELRMSARYNVPARL